jgi:23S rRNA pseudouridine1911/1915/1917 synthase
MNESTITFTIASEEAGHRADRVIAGRLEDLSRSAIQRLIEQGEVTVKPAAALPQTPGDTQPITPKPKTILHEGDEVTVRIPPPVDATPEPQDIPLDVVYEDSDIIVINKQADFVVHPAPGAPDATLVNALLHHCKDLSGVGGVKRPGIVHRLDKDTTGLIVAAKNDLAHESLTAQIARRDMKRVYLALVAGSMEEDSGQIEASIGRSRRDRTQMSVCADGREARTHWRIERRTHGMTLLRVELDTGRTHQIRVHMAHIGHPVIGDPDYGTNPKQVAALLPEKAQKLRRMARNAKRQMLHATRLSFNHPRTGQPMTFDAPPPEDFQRLIDLLPEAD